MYTTIRHDHSHKCTNGGRQGPTLHVNSSLVLAVQMRGRPIGIRLSSFQPYADAQKVEKWHLGLVVSDKTKKLHIFYYGSVCPSADGSWGRGNLTVYV
jgi:hypothetical protein